MLQYLYRDHLANIWDHYQVLEILNINPVDNDRVSEGKPSIHKTSGVVCLQQLCCKSWQCRWCSHSQQRQQQPVMLLQSYNVSLSSSEQKLLGLGTQLFRTMIGQSDGIQGRFMLPLNKEKISLFGDKIETKMIFFNEEVCQILILSEKFRWDEIFY